MIFAVDRSISIVRTQINRKIEFKAMILSKSGNILDGEAIEVRKVSSLINVF